MRLSASPPIEPLEVPTPDERPLASVTFSQRRLALSRLYAACVGLALEAVTLLVPVASAGGAPNCMDRFPEGWYGIPVDHPAIGVTPILAGFSPLYVQKLPVAIATPADCEYVYTADVFRLVASPTALLAGCIGDFDGDGRPDVALLMRRQGDGRIMPVVLRSLGARRDVTLIEAITDPYGFNEDPTVWPGPFCVPRPPNGVFASDVGDRVAVVGDLFTIGWRTYFWSTATHRFESILTSD